MELIARAYLSIVLARLKQQCHHRLLNGVSLVHKHIGDIEVVAMVPPPPQLWAQVLTLRERQRCVGCASMSLVSHRSSALTCSLSDSRSIRMVS